MEKRDARKFTHEDHVAAVLETVAKVWGQHADRTLAQLILGTGADYAIYDITDAEFLVKLKARWED